MVGLLYVNRRGASDPIMLAPIIAITASGDLIISFPFGCRNVAAPASVVLVVFEWVWRSEQIVCWLACIFGGCSQQDVIINCHTGISDYFTSEN